MTKVEEFANELIKILWYHVVYQLEEDPNKTNIKEMMDCDSWNYFFYFKPPPLHMREDILMLVKFLWESKLVGYNK